MKNTKKPVTKEEYPAGSLVFVWNAGAGVLNAIKDSLHKWISPETYTCRLCSLTHGFSSEKQDWKEFLQALDRPVFFYYRDTFEATGIKGDFSSGFPVVLERLEKGWRSVLGPEDLTGIGTLDELIQRLKAETGRGQAFAGDIRNCNENAG